MYDQLNLLAYKARNGIAIVLSIVIIVLFSALVTNLGAHSALDARSATKSTPVTVTPDSTNVVTTSAYGFVNASKTIMLTAGTDMYSVCRATTEKTLAIGHAIGHGVSTAVGDVGHSIAFAGTGIGHGALFFFRIPGTVMGSVTSRGTQVVSASIRPADDTQLPVISAETSASILAKLDAKERQQVQTLQATQVVANRNLDGAVVAGDPAHGGYPTRWDNSPQDSMLDNWGMYNRECVSYTAWKVYQTYGHMPYWGGVGNANQWVRDARAAGIPTGYTPQVHSVAISMRGYYGHAMWVEAVQGNMIYVSQYNYDLYGHYSEMWVNSSYFTYIYFK